MRGRTCFVAVIEFAITEVCADISAR